MKNLTYFFYLLIALLVPTSLLAQNGATQMNELPKVYIYPDNTLHFLSPQPIKYVDISSHKIQGDLPVENMLRIKFKKDSIDNKFDQQELGSITIVAEDFITQYRLCYTPIYKQDITSLIEISPQQTRPLNNTNDQLSHVSKKEIALNLLSKKVKKPIEHEKDFGITLAVNQIYTLGDHIFLDISFTNSTNLSYDIDEFRFFLEDKKIVKASNFQSLEIKPLWMFNELKSFKSKQRNIYVIKKVIFPSNKVLKLSLTEKQPSGRLINVNINYHDILQAPSI